MARTSGHSLTRICLSEQTVSARVDSTVRMYMHNAVRDCGVRDCDVRDCDMRDCDMRDCDVRVSSAIVIG